VDRQGNLVLYCAGLSESGIHIRAGNVVRRPDFHQLGQRLYQARSAGREIQSTLIEDQRRRRNQISSRGAKTPSRNLNELSIGNVHEAAVVAKVPGK